MAPRVRQDRNDILPPPSQKEAVPSAVMRGLEELDGDDDGDFDIPDAEAIK